MQLSWPRPRAGADRLHVVPVVTDPLSSCVLGKVVRTLLRTLPVRRRVGHVPDLVQEQPRHAITSESERPRQEENLAASRVGKGEIPHPAPALHALCANERERRPPRPGVALGKPPPEV